MRLHQVYKYCKEPLNIGSSRNGVQGVNLLGISDAAEKIGFQTSGLKLSFEKLIEEAPKPAILHWGQNHFIVLPPQKRAFFQRPKT